MLRVPSEGRAMTSPVVSVCVPTFNYGRFLPQCLGSVLAQTYSDWELIICDDQSTDETEAIVARYAVIDGRIRYLKNEVRLGMSANLRRVADLGEGSYLKILCSDDWIDPSCLEVLVDLMEDRGEVVLATSAVTQTDEDGRPYAVEFEFGEAVSVIPGEAMLDRMARGQGFGGNSSFMIRRTAYWDVGGYRPHRTYAGDFDLAAMLCRVGDYLHVDRPLFFGRQHGASSSSVNPKTLLDVIAIGSRSPTRSFGRDHLGAASGGGTRGFQRR